MSAKTLDNIAEQVAHAYGGDGMQWTAKDPAISGQEPMAGDEVHLEDFTDHIGVEWHYREDGNHRFEFSDGSAIVTSGGAAWDVGFRGECLECICWPDANHGRHNEGCAADREVL